MAALMTSDYDDTDRLAIEITECKHMGIAVLPPDVNESFHEFAVVPDQNQIRFGLDAIKNVGHGAVEEILRAREAAGGQFKSLEDFAKHVNPSICNRKTLESLVRAGAMDRFGERGLLFNNLEGILNLSQRIQKDALSGQVDLFGESDSVSQMALALTLDQNGPEIPQHEQLAWERELLGLYLSHNPLEAYEALLAGEATSIQKTMSLPIGTSVIVGGAINESREITTKNGSKMAFVKIEDPTGEIELVVFPKSFLKTADIWQRDHVVLAQGKVGSGRAVGDDSEHKVLVDNAKLVTIEEAQAYEPDKFRSGFKKAAAKASLAGPVASISVNPRLYLRLEDSNDQQALLSLKEKLDGHKGDTEVVLVTGPSDNKQIIKLPQTIDVNEECLRDLAGIFGSTNVVVR